MRYAILNIDGATICYENKLNNKWDPDLGEQGNINNGWRKTDCANVPSLTLNNGRPEWLFPGGKPTRISDLEEKGTLKQFVAEDIANNGSNPGNVGQKPCNCNDSSSSSSSSNKSFNFTPMGIVIGVLAAFGIGMGIYNIFYSKPSKS